MPYNSTHCARITGHVTISTASATPNDLSKITTTAADIIETLINSGQYDDNIIEGIQRVRFVEPLAIQQEQEAIPPSDVHATNNEANIPKSTKGTLWLRFGLIALAVVFAAVIFVLIIRNRRIVLPEQEKSILKNSRDEVERTPMADSSENAEASGGESIQGAPPTSIPGTDGLSTQEDSSVAFFFLSAEGAEGEVIVIPSEHNSHTASQVTEKINHKTSEAERNGTQAQSDSSCFEV